MKAESLAVKPRLVSVDTRRTAISPVGVLMAVGCAAALLLVVVLGVRLTFFNDDWYVLLQRPGLSSGHGADVVLAPANGNIVVLWVAVYKVMAMLFGFGSQVPYRVFLGITVAALGAVVYLIVGVRVGRVAGFVAAMVVLFLGPAWEAMLWFAGFGDYGAVALGLAALLVLERDTPRCNVAACLLLAVSVLWFSMGVPFVVGAAVVIALRRRASQLWIPAIPAALFGVWWLAYGSSQPTHFSITNLEHLPTWLLDSPSVALAAAAGLDRGHAGDVLVHSDIPLAVAAIATAVVVWKRGRPSAWILPFAVTALTFWVLTGLGSTPGRAPESSRYLVFDVPLVIVLAAELLRGVRLSRPAAGALLIAGLAVIASNSSPLEAGYDFMSNHAGFAKADLGALELARGRAPATMWLLQPIAHDQFLSGVTAGQYFAQSRRHGSPPHDSPAEIVAAPPAERAAADSVLANAYSIVPRQLIRPFRTTGCPRLPLRGAGAKTDIQLTPGGALVANLSATPLVVGVRRFAPSSDPHYVGFLPAKARVQLAIPPDRASTAWHLILFDGREASATVSVCHAGPSAAYHVLS